MKIKCTYINIEGSENGISHKAESDCINVTLNKLYIVIRSLDGGGVEIIDDSGNKIKISKSLYYPDKYNHNGSPSYDCFIWFSGVDLHE